MSTVVIPTGAANLASVLAALRRLDLEPRLAALPRDVETAARVILPGVGAFGPARTTLDAAGFTGPLRERVLRGRATLAICLGMQLLCDESEESPNSNGVGCIPGRVTAFPESVTSPQLGWNRVAPQDCHTVEPGYAYYANSFRLTEPPAGWRAARSEHGGSFVAAVERDAVLACQFHPELSGAWGAALLRRWQEVSRC